MALLRPASRVPAPVLLSALLLLPAFGTSPVSAAVWVAEAALASADPVSITVTIDDVAEEVDFELTGPDDKWFATGFGASIMSGTYAIVTDPGGTAVERQLGNHTAGSVLSQQTISTPSHVLNGDGTATFTTTRAMDPGVPQVYVFPMGSVQSGTPIPIILAVGQGADFQYHGGSNRGSSTLAFEPGGAVSAPEDGVVDRSWALTKLTFRRVDR